MNGYRNSVMYNDTTDRDRAIYCKRFIDALVASPYGPTERTDFLFCSSEHQWEKTHPGRCVPSEYPNVFDGEQAINYIRNGNRRLVLFFGDPVAGTKDLVHVDIDVPSLGRNLPNSLTINSGTNGHYHKVYHNVDNSVRNETHHAGSMVSAEPNGRHSSWVVVPGSVHESGAVYHMERPQGREIADLTPDQLPAELRAD